MCRGDHQCDWCDQQEQERYDEPGDADEHKDGLPLAGQEVDVAHRLRHPHEHRYAHQDDQERAKRGAKDITPDGPHISVQSPVDPLYPSELVARPFWTCPAWSALVLVPC